MGFFAETNRILCRPYFIPRVHCNTVSDHKVDELGHAGFLGARSVVCRNNHLG